MVATSRKQAPTETVRLPNGLYVREDTGNHERDPTKDQGEDEDEDTRRWAITGRNHGRAFCSASNGQSSTVRVVSN